MRVLVTGSSGQLGAYLLRELRGQGDEVIAWTGARTGELFNTPLRPVDLADREAVVTAFRAARPEGVLHAAALASVADCHRDPERAHAINTRASALLAELADDARARLVFVSTDLVFDGEKGNYREGDAPAPLSHYGRTKHEAEQAVLRTPHAAVVRVSLLFGPHLAGGVSFFEQQVRKLREGAGVVCFHDEWRSPLGLHLAAQNLLAVLRWGFEGLLHLGGAERLSRAEMGRRLAGTLGVDPALVTESSRCAVPAAEPRPRDVSLNSTRWRTLFPDQPWPSLEEALSQMGVAHTPLR
ncbi:MAG: SDR family oxidoreductase [Gemmataceae bacterium]|nr:SDR family oxidoreductase [Gemmataceae bacterium]